MSPIPLGILAASGGGPGEPYKWLETITLGSNQQSITFSNLNSKYGSSYRHLQLRVVVGQTAGSSVDMILNGATSGYRHAFLTSNGTINLSSSAGGVSYLPDIIYTATNFGTLVFEFTNAFQPQNKTTRGITGASDAMARIYNGRLETTNPLDTLTIRSRAQNLAANSRFSLYGYGA